MPETSREDCDCHHVNAVSCAEPILEAPRCETPRLPALIQKENSCGPRSGEQEDDCAGTG